MHQIRAVELGSPEYPLVLSHISSPPKFLYVRGNSLQKILEYPAVAIVGTRNMSRYGDQVTEKLAREVAEQGIVIISGLAIGVDTVALTAAVKAGGKAIAVLPSPLDNVLPVTNRSLARKIIDNGGALVSEYPPGTLPQRQYFIARNRLMSGLSQMVIITEAGKGSGALYTANFAHEQGRDLLAVPGKITDPGSTGTNNLLKNKEAGVVVSVDDVLFGLGLFGHKTKIKEVKGSNRNEQLLLDLILKGISDAEELLENSGLEVARFNQALSMLEITGKIRPLGANHWAIS